MGKWLFGYVMFLIGLFAVCSASVGLKTALWGFGFVHLGCTLVVLGLWWRDERRWGQVRMTGLPVYEPGLESLPYVPQSVLKLQESLASIAWLSLKDEDLDIIASYTEALTKRVSTVYPLVAQEHIRKIVWTVLLELLCKQGVELTETGEASVLSVEIAKVA